MTLSHPELGTVDLVRHGTAGRLYPASREDMRLLPSQLVRETEPWIMPGRDRTSEETGGAFGDPIANLHPIDRKGKVFTLDFRRLLWPSFALLGREIMWVRINKHDSRVSYLPGSKRDVSSSTAFGTWMGLVYAAHFMVETHASPDVRYWTPDTITEFTDWLPHKSADNRASYLKWLAFAWQWRSVLTNFDLEVDPFGRTPLIEVAGVGAPGGATKTEPLPPEVAVPLLQAASAYVECAAVDILPALRDARASETLRRPRPGPRLQDDRGRHLGDFQIAFLERWADPSFTLPVHADDLDPSKDHMWADDAVRLDRRALATVLEFHYETDLRGVHALDEYQQMVDDGRLVQGHWPITGVLPEGGPWRQQNLCSLTVEYEADALAFACLIITAATLGMRTEELSVIPAEDPITESFGTQAVRSRVFKQRHTVEGDEDTWWAGDLAICAVQVAQELAAIRDPEADYLFTTKQFKEHLQRFAARVAENPALPNIPDGHRVHIQRLRVMNAAISAQNPAFHLTLKHQLKHQNVLTTQQYGMRGDGKNPYVLEAAKVSADLSVQITVDLFARTAAEQTKLVGPGGKVMAKELTDAWERLAEIAPDATTAEEFKAIIATDHTLMGYMARYAGTVRFGTTNHCLGRIEKARCATPQQAQGEAWVPRLDVCDFGCENCVFDAETHAPAFEKLRDNIVSFRKRLPVVGNKPQPQGEYLDQQLEQVDRILKQMETDRG